MRAGGPRCSLALTAPPVSGLLRHPLRRALLLHSLLSTPAVSRWPGLVSSELQLHTPDCLREVSTRTSQGLLRPSAPTAELSSWSPKPATVPFRSSHARRGQGQTLPSSCPHTPSTHTPSAPKYKEASPQWILKGPLLFPEDKI